MKIPGTINAVLEQKGTDVYAVSPQITVFDAIQEMADKNVGALVVLEGQRLVGMISERDYTRKVALKGKVSKQVAVQEIMTRPVITVTLEHTVEECLRLMTDHRVRHLPVIDSEKVVGIVSIGNLVNWIISAQSAAIEHLADYICGKYPG
jgi:CBS domain-containing protein